MKEVWKDVTGFEGLYQVSDLGRIKSLPRQCWMNSKGKTYRSVPERIMKSSLIGKGYKMVYLSKDGRVYSRLLARIVAEAFVPNPKNKPEVNHVDLDKLNCRASNLEWTTRLENMRHAYANGAIPFMEGERGGGSKLKNEQVLAIRRRRKKGIRVKQLASEYGVHECAIYRILSRATWKHI